MCSVPSYDSSTVTEVPTPEVVQRVDEEVQAVRDNAQTEAANRYGTAGTDVTNGSLTDESLVTQKTKLGQ